MDKKNTLKNIKNKVRISGNVVEIFTYENGYFKGYQSVNKKGRASNETSDEDKKINRKKCMQRAKTRVRNLANANPQLDKFFTLTFDTYITDLKISNRLFNNFIKRLNRRLDKMGKEHIQYIAVIEFQESGRIHYHILCKLPFILQSELQSLWNNGYVWIVKIDDIDNVGVYVTSYMTKDNETEKLKGNRSYFTSQGLKQPIEITNTDIPKEIYSALLCGELRTKKEPFSTTFENEHLGKIEYTQIALEKPLKLGLLYRQKVKD